MSLKILVIDDDTQFKRLLELRLRSFMDDVEFTTFDNLTSAREFLKTQTRIDYELVVLDEHLPDGRGVELLREGWFENLAVLTISSDTAPEIPGASLEAGSMFFLNKIQIKEALFEPLIRGIIERNRIQKELSQAQLDAARSDTVRTLVATLRHEINNPLGAVFGAAYILKSNQTATPEQVEAINLVESSSKRIKHVLDELCKVMELEPVTKGNQKVFHIPGDAPWESSEDS